MYLTMTIRPGQCALEETGSGYKADAFRLDGKLHEVDPQVFQCTVEVPQTQFVEKLGTCYLSGFNVPAGYFFKGDRSTRRKSCDLRPLRNSNMYVEATGIDQDSCDWICVPSAKDWLK